MYGWADAINWRDGRGLARDAQTNRYGTLALTLTIDNGEWMERPAKSKRDACEQFPSRPHSPLRIEKHPDRSRAEEMNDGRERAAGEGYAELTTNRH
jgi:hypothetical protein